MDCMKCGSPTQGEQVFCSKCLRSAAAAPVRADIHVALPQRREPAVRKLQPKPPKPEDVIADLERRLHRMAVAVALLSVLLTVALGSLGLMIYRELSVPEIGQNYHTVSTE